MYISKHGNSGRGNSSPYPTTEHQQLMQGKLPLSEEKDSIEEDEEKKELNSGINSDSATADPSQAVDSDVLKKYTPVISRSKLLGK